MKELRHLNKYFRKYRFKLLLGVLITIIARVFQLVMPSYVKNIVEVVEQYTSGTLERSLAQQYLLEYIGIIVGAALAGRQTGISFCGSSARLSRPTIKFMNFWRTKELHGWTTFPW